MLSEVEKIICSDDELSKLDESLQKAYVKALKRSDIKEQLIISQGEWLRNVRNICTNLECIENAYNTRIKELDLASSYGFVFFSDPNQNSPTPKPKKKISKVNVPKQSSEAIFVELDQMTPTQKRKDKTPNIKIDKKNAGVLRNKSRQQNEPTSVSVEIKVPGTSDPWLAGMPDGSKASSVDSAPYQSPILVPGIDLIPGGVLTFSVSGGVYNTSGCPPSCNPPDGENFQAHDNGAENGFPNINARMNALVGVFINDKQPNTSSPPPMLDFSKIGFSFSSLYPSLNQIFFIGDGLTGDNCGSVQTFIIPAGATRLFLGTMDSWEWSDNSGAFIVRVTLTTTPSQYFDITEIPDVNGDGRKDYAALLMKSSYYYLLTIDSATGKQLKQVTLGIETDITPVALTAATDKISVLITKSTGLSIIQLRDSKTLGLIKTSKLPQ